MVDIFMLIIKHLGRRRQLCLSNKQSLQSCQSLLNPAGIWTVLSVFTDRSKQELFSDLLEVCHQFVAPKGGSQTLQLLSCMLGEGGGSQAAL